MIDYLKGIFMIVFSAISFVSSTTYECQICFAEDIIKQFPEKFQN